MAKAECEKLGWPWREPVKVRVSVTLPPSDAGLLQYNVLTNADVHGDNPWFDVSLDGRHVLAGWNGEPDDGSSAEPRGPAG